MSKMTFVSDQLAPPGGFGGAELVLDLVSDLYPEVPIYTTVYDPRRFPARFQHKPIHTSFLQKLPFAPSHPQFYLPLIPWAIESLNLQDYDVVVSFHYIGAKAAIVRPDATHICYCYSPARYFWDQYWTYMDQMPWWQTLPFGLAAPLLRTWDTQTASRVDQFLAISQFTAHRIRKYYRREAQVLYPPVYTDKFFHRPAEDFYLMVGRLVEYKGFELAVETFNRLGKKLIIVGNGPLKSRLKKAAGSTIELCGRLSDAEVVDLMSRCQGFVFPGVEDFGIAMVEAQAAGKPVIALNRGGASEIVVPDETGILVDEKSPLAFMDAINRCEKANWSPGLIQNNSKRFSVENFINGFNRVVLPCLGKLPATLPQKPFKDRAAKSA